MEIVAEKRAEAGRKVKILRRKGIIPAVIYGKGTPSVPLQVGLEDIQNMLKGGETSLVNIQIRGKGKEKVLIANIQRHPVSNEIVHISFHKVSLTEKITTKVPLEIIGESPSAKSGVGILLTLLDEIEIECLPTDIPTSLKIDVSNLNTIGQTLLVKDVLTDTGKIKIKTGLEDPLVKLDYAEQLETEEEKPEKEGNIEEEPKGEGESVESIDEKEKGE